MMCNLVKRLKETSHDEWEDIIAREAYSDVFSDLILSSTAAKHEAEKLAFVGDYLTYRAINNLDENGHRNALAYALRRRGAVREALGF
jgi:hypothetical protein